MSQTTERTYVFVRKQQPTEGQCLLVHNGIACNRPSGARGICTEHAPSLLKAQGLTSAMHFQKKAGNIDSSSSKSAILGLPGHCERCSMQRRGWDIKLSTLGRIESGDRTITDHEFVFLLKVLGFGLEDLQPSATRFRPGRRLW